MENSASEARYWRNVDKRGPDECWLWKGPLSPGGYGRGSLNGHRSQAHRIAFELANGHKPYPLGLHSCDNRLCCNPAHLWEGDHADNTRDMVAKGRWGNQYKLRAGPPAPPKTHCLRGHEFTPENTYLYRSGSRACRTCCRTKDARRAIAQVPA